MANTVIQLKHSTTSGNTPASLANGELALNNFDGKLFYRDPSGTIQTIQRFTGPAGLNQEVQFNDSGTLGANAGLTFAKTTGLLSATLLKSTQSSGDEGGQIDLSTAATNTTLVGGSVAIDIYQNRLRIFETGGTNRGVYIDITGAGTGVSTDLLASSGSVDSTARTSAQAAFNQANNAANTAATGVTTITNDATSATSRYIVLTTQTSGNLTIANTSLDGLYYTPSTGTLNANNFNSLSDERFKDNIQTIDDSEFVLKNLKGVSFNWKSTGKKSYGVIAQEVEVILPEIVETNDSGVKTVNYNALIPFLIEAIKRQQEEIDTLKKKLLQ